MPNVWVLTLSHFCRVFVDRTVPEIIETILEDSGLSDADYELRLQESYAPHFHTCQYKESRWAFLSRLMEREGLYYFFEHGEAGEKLVVTDHRSFHQPLRQSGVRYVPLSGGDDAMSAEALRLFTSRSRALPRAVKLRDFDYLKPGLDVSDEQSVWDEASAMQVHLGEHDFRTPDAGKPKARALAEALKARELTYQGRGRAFGLRAGYRFSLEEHPLDGMNREYLAVGLRHQGVQAADSELVRELLGITAGEDYRVEVDAIDAAVQWRSPKRTPVPRISSVERAFVDGPADSEYAQIDEHGRYKVKLHFDIDDSDLWDGEASTWIRMLQPHGGSTEGFHFPLRKQTEVLILFLGGDPDRPVIAGAVPNATQPSPVTSKNHTQNVLQTGGASRIEIEDQDGKRYVDISTPPQNTFIHLGIPHDEHTHTIVFNTEGNQLVNIGGNRDIEVGGPQNEHVVGDVTETYDANHSTTVAAVRTQRVGGAVNETYSTSHDTLVQGPRTEIVTAAVTETYNSQHTNVATSLTYEAATTTFNFGTTNFNSFGQTNLTFGPNTLNLGPSSGKIASVDWNIPGGATITASKWDVKVPTDIWSFVDFSYVGSKKTEIAAVAMAATGLKAEACGVAFSASLYAGVRAATNNKKAGANVETEGTDAKTSGLKSFLTGMFSVA
ncbi:MAG: type VI secretion system tip protein TssI/VgrG [Polyangiaceae bacterium]